MTRAKLGILYYRFKPSMPYWIVFIVVRKMCMAGITVLFQTSASFSGTAEPAVPTATTEGAESRRDAEKSREQRAR